MNMTFYLASILLVAVLATSSAGKIHIYSTNKTFVIKIFFLKGPFLNPADDGRIIGTPGQDLAVEGDFPYLASITVDSLHTCSGWIHNDGWVITAANCVIGWVPSTLNDFYNIN